MVGFITGFFSEILGSDLEQFRSVGFPEDQQARGLDDAVRDTGGIEDPSPGGVFGYKATCNWAGCWAQKRRQTVYRNCFTPLFGGEAVAKNTAANLHHHQYTVLFALFSTYS